MMQIVKKLAAPWPTIVVHRLRVELALGRRGRHGTPVTPPRPSGSRMQTSSMNIAELRSAFVRVRLVLYSGANVAQPSVPYADQARMNM